MELVRESMAGSPNEVVSAVRYKDVFGDHDRERVNDRCHAAYMLFYCRTAPTRT